MIVKMIYNGLNEARASAEYVTQLSSYRLEILSVRGDKELHDLLKELGIIRSPFNEELHAPLNVSPVRQV